jgi:hypothetical protein
MRTVGIAGDYHGRRRLVIAGVDPALDRFAKMMALGSTGTTK